MTEVYKRFPLPDGFFREPVRTYIINCTSLNRPLAIKLSVKVHDHTPHFLSAPPLLWKKNINAFEERNRPFMRSNASDGNRMRRSKDLAEERRMGNARYTLLGLASIFHSLIFHHYSQKIAFPNFMQSCRITFWYTFDIFYVFYSKSTKFQPFSP